MTNRDKYQVLGKKKTRKKKRYFKYSIPYFKTIVVAATTLTLGHYAIENNWHKKIKTEALTISSFLSTDNNSSNKSFSEVKNKISSQYSTNQISFFDDLIDKIPKIDFSFFEKKDSKTTIPYVVSKPNKTNTNKSNKVEIQPRKEETLLEKLSKDETFKRFNLDINKGNKLERLVCIKGEDNLGKVYLENGTKLTYMGNFSEFINKMIKEEHNYGVNVSPFMTYALNSNLKMNNPCIDSIPKKECFMSFYNSTHK